MSVPYVERITVSNGVSTLVFGTTRRDRQLGRTLKRVTKPVIMVRRPSEGIRRRAFGSIKANRKLTLRGRGATALTRRPRLATGKGCRDSSQSPVVVSTRRGVGRVHRRQAVTVSRPKRPIVVAVVRLDDFRIELHGVAVEHTLCDEMLVILTL